MKDFRYFVSVFYLVFDTEIKSSMNEFEFISNVFVYNGVD